MRIAGITLPNEKRIDIALTAVYGIGRSLAKQILAKAGVDPSKKAKDVTEEESTAIKKVIDQEGILIEGDLRRQKSADIKRLIDIGSYRGIRHTKRLPVRGQTTRTNSRTVRGNRRVTMGSGRIKATKK